MPEAIVPFKRDPLDVAFASMMAGEVYGFRFPGDDMHVEAGYFAVTRSDVTYVDTVGEGNVPGAGPNDEMLERMVENHLPDLEKKNYQNIAKTLGISMEDVVERGGYQFKTRKHQTENHILKDIEVRDGETVHLFQEQVRIFSKDDLENLHRQAGLEVIAVFGDYSLGAFDEKTSPRIVLVSKKS